MDCSPFHAADIAPYFADGLAPKAWTIGSACLSGILLEVATHPKPGLVTPRSMGAHTDMDQQTFMLTSAAIAPCFHRCASIGFSHRGDAVSALPLVRAVGREYDALLMAASNGVNTQRGALFALGVTAAAAGRAARDDAAPSAHRIFAEVAAITSGMVQRELIDRRTDPVTAGEKLYARHGTRGIRGEVEDGFPAVARHGLPTLRAAIAAGHGLNRALVHTLIELIAEAEDSTVLWRGGPDALAFVQGEARRIRDLGGGLTSRGVEAIHAFGAECVARRISAGGAADLLAVTIAVHLIEHRTFPSSATAGFETLHATGDHP
ncbi:Triphosphoribosyl-dephospho-CoA synthase [Rhodopseudomonas palustris HaA2]|uniref:Probable 2-(5''-triphosphoribosyl)-3'-dephosphocoenzyme-A synthase n=1 Tax=Rhodopseudomonas palustris (strain HaA2) TaxID=316058 RepID=Q2IUW3_RHOP2|nr:triphosphoribosyl-dephospho-CoA synthase MdcB [Rhodopseudomonas palustris]ABD07997.1 Triphosphoribosyl-dephospho-CoA synthase [Rhodopseudomonas palustris HaA2]